MKKIGAARKTALPIRPAKIQSILATTDFSEDSLSGVSYAVILAEKVGASLHLLHVVEPPSRFSGMEDVAGALTDSQVAELARSQLKDLCKREIQSNVRVRTSVRIGKAFHEITIAARKSSANLIVIATHGYTAAKRVLLGSTSERVVRHAHCPVLTVPAGAGSGAKPVPFRLKKILVPIDFSKVSRDALPWAILLGRQFGSTLTLLHVVEKFPIDYTLADRGLDLIRRAEEQAVGDLQAMARSLTQSSGLNISTRVHGGSPYEQICEAARVMSTDLIVLTTHGYTGLKHVWLGSTAERIVRHARCPVLAVRQSQRR